MGVTNLRAEIISIGDEMTSGQRLDTNTQWLSHKLGEAGVQIAFHTTVADVLEDNVSVFEIAFRRADIVVCTGGLGPTKDDLTREAIARATGVELEFHPSVVDHIRSLFKAYGRDMPDNNLVQAYFPQGAKIIDNPEGTAPGIDMIVKRDRHECRLFAMPGVPAEMKQMWHQEIGAAIRTMTGETRTTCHHVIHCIGKGESQVETMLPDLINRDRLPRVGITASQAVISLRVTATSSTEQECREQMQSTLETIRQKLGDLVYGENDETLEEIVINLLRQRNQKLSIVDFGLCGSVAHTLGHHDRLGRTIVGSLQLPTKKMATWLGRNESIHSKEFLGQCAQKISEQFDSEMGVAIGPLAHSDETDVREFGVAINMDNKIEYCLLSYGGHSDFRDVRSQKHVLNQIRLVLR